MKAKKFIQPRKTGKWKLQKGYKNGGNWSKKNNTFAKQQINGGHIARGFAEANPKLIPIPIAAAIAILDEPRALILQHTHHFFQNSRTEVVISGFSV